MTDVVCLGILVADVLVHPVDGAPRGRLALVEDVVLRGGGCALNTSTVLARLGLSAAAAGKVGADPFGDFLLGLLDERGIDRTRVLRDPEVPTSATVVLVGSDGERTFLHASGANGALRADELDLESLYAARALHAAGALVLPALDGEPLAELLAGARERGLLTSLDPVWDATGGWERVLPSLPYLDVATPSLEEGRAISGERAPADVARWLRARGVRTVALTMGADGCYVAGDGFEGRLEAVPVLAVDGTGAGDAFAAALLYGLLEGWPLERAARLANSAGALATTAYGASEGVGDLEQTLALGGA